MNPTGTQTRPLPPPPEQVTAAAAAPRDAAHRDRRPTSIVSIGTAVPAAAYSQADMAEFMREVLDAEPRLGRRLEVLYRRSGIARRHSCLRDFGCRPEDFELLPADWTRDAGPSTSRRMQIYEREAAALAVEAVRAAAARAPRLDLARLTHLIVVSCTGFAAPGLDVDLVHRLGLRPDIARVQIGFQGCHAGIASLRLADSICRADPGAGVLVVCVELCSLHFQTAPTEDHLLANALFADGAGAVILHAAGDDGGAGGAAATGPALTIRRAGSWLEPDTRRELVWSVGDHGFEMRLSALIPRLLGVNVGRFLRNVMGLGASEIADIDCWAVHPGGPAILDRIERSLGLAPQLLAASRDVLRDYGNMSSPTILFVLERLCSRLAGGDGRRSASPATTASPATPASPATTASPATPASPATTASPATAASPATTASPAAPAAVPPRRAPPPRGVALAFGPGLTIEGLLFDVHGDRS